MKSLADGLPPEIAKAIHPDWRKNEADYWAVRAQLLEQYRDRWIGFGDGKVLVSGMSPVEVGHAAHELAPHPFITCVGREFEPCRIRRTTFLFDSTYNGEPLPVMSVEFRIKPRSPGPVLDRVIPDTGADASALPWSDCQQLGLTFAQGEPSRFGGVGGTSMPSLVFWIWVYLDGLEYRCRIQTDFTGRDRILGRDVLNQIEVLFRGPSREVVVNP